MTKSEKRIELDQIDKVWRQWVAAGFGSVGFLGSESGMSVRQLQRFEDFCQMCKKDVPKMELHLCDRRGADVEAELIARANGFKTIAHPHTNALYRAYVPANEQRAALPSFRATKNVADACSLVVAAPMAGAELIIGVDRWDMVQLARRAGKPVVVIHP
jgi:hypothetical protein